MAIKDPDKLIIKQDLDPQIDTQIQLKQILNNHPDWYLVTYHSVTYHINMQQTDDQPHIVAKFIPMQYGTALDRHDGLRWGFVSDVAMRNASEK